MRKALEVIGSIATRASEVVLFHSASGKDSIALLDLLYPHFDRILCVFMYTVPNLRHINRYINYARTKYGIEWACYGFKQSDGMNRRLMLRGYEQNAICEATHKFFPLSEYKNADILSYIEANNLIKPEKYGNTQSAGTNISDLNYLNFLRTNYPDDLRKVIAEFPMVERLLFEQDYEATKNERDEDN